MRSAILKSSLLISALSALSILAELLKDMLVAAKMGASVEGDAFFAATTIPLLLIGALLQSYQLSFVPLLSASEVQKGASESKRLVNVLITITIPFLLALVAGCILFAPALASLVGAGFSPAGRELTLKLSQITFLAVLATGLTGVLMNWLNSQGRFAAPASINLARSLGMTAVIWFLWETLGVYSAALAFLVGSLLQFILIAIVAWVHGLRFRFEKAASLAEVRRILGLIAWPLGLIMLRQANTVIERMFASYLDPGSISVLSYAFRIIVGLVVIFSSSIFTAALPALSRNAGSEDLDQLRRNLTTAVKMVSLALAFIVVYLIAFSRSIVAVVYERGAFDAAAAATTSQVLAYYSLSLLLRALIPLYQMPFYALSDVKTPIILSIAAAALQVIFNILLVPWLNLLGLVIADTLARALELSVNYLLLRRRIANPIEKDISIYWFKIILAAMGTWLLFAMMKIPLGMYTPDNFWGHALRLSLALAAGGVLYFAALSQLQVKEVNELLQRLLTRSRRFMQPTKI